MKQISIKLNRSTNKIQVKRIQNNIRLGINRRRINLTHSGLRGPQGLKGDTGDTGSQGDSVRFRGEWNSSSEYYAGANGEVSTVEWNGNSYMATAGGTNHEPDTLDGAAYWGLMAEKGDTGVSTFVRVHHGTDPNVARPNALYVEWVGSVAPVNATVEDTWIDTA